MAAPVEVRSQDGSFMKMLVYDNNYFMSFFVGNIKDHLADIEQMEVRDDDTFVLTYPKSGTHWAYTLSSMLRTGETTYHGSPTFLDFTNMETINNLPSPRVLASHLTFNFMPRQIKEGKGKVVSMLRNPKDVASSMYTFAKKLDHPDYQARYQLSWEGLLELYLGGRVPSGTWFEYIQAWDRVKRDHKGNNIIHLIYEDMKQDLGSNVRDLAVFLGASCEQDFLDKVTENCTFKSMSTDSANLTPSEQWMNVTNNKILPIYRKGEVGDWKNYFTVAQNEHFDKVYKEKMKTSSFNFRFQ
ncbi:sulfotransferase 1A1-like [Argopecten irradians]|uniref:sulfotransferase 1A1-like n=1 Tax=Argopecten irradians TaxID=31199 RepID=UPI003711319F